MLLKDQSLSIRTVYAELAQLCLDAEAAGIDPTSYDAVGVTTPTAKTIKGRIYWYIQYTDIEGRQQQSYIGPDNEATQKTLSDLQNQSAREDLQRRRDMVKMLRSAGFATLNYLASGAILALDRTGIFKSGVTLVGTPAYQAILNRFGVSESPPIQTNDIDFSVRHFELAIPERVDLHTAMQEWNPKSFPVPSFNLKDGPSSFKIRGKDFHIDFLTHGTSNEIGKSVRLPNLGFSAQKLPFLDYLVGNAEKTLLLSTYGVVISVPNAARFAFHKCAVAAGRPTIFDAKREKDKHQARILFDILLERDPDEIVSAYQSIRSAQEGDLLLMKIMKTLNETSMSDVLLRIGNILQNAGISFGHAEEKLEQAFHKGTLPRPNAGTLTGTVRALVKDANMNAFALVENADGQAFAVPVSNAHWKQLVVGGEAAFDVKRPTLNAFVEVFQELIAAYPETRPETTGNAPTSRKKLSSSHKKRGGPK